MTTKNVDGHANSIPNYVQPIISVRQGPKWSKWERSARRIWQSFSVFSIYFSTRNARIVASLFFFSWILYATWLSERHNALLGSILSTAGFTPIEILISGQSRSDISSLVTFIDALKKKSLLSVDENSIHEELNKLPWVDTIDIKYNYPNKLVIRINEHVPYALWQTNRKLYLINKNGHVITNVISNNDIINTPLIVGNKANELAASAMAIIEANKNLKPLIRAAILVAGRRWDLLTHDGVLIKLPEIGTIEAVHRVAELQRTKMILDRDVLIIDLRIPGRLVVRISEDAALQRRVKFNYGANANQEGTLNRRIKLPSPLLACLNERTGGERII